MKIDIDALKKESATIIDERHDWGYQIRLVNTKLYCGKLLVLTNGVHGSYHKHPIKDEAFVVLKGEVFVKRKDSVGLYKLGEAVRMEAGVPHEMRAKTIPAVILEVSTHDDNMDYEEVI